MDFRSFILTLLLWFIPQSVMALPEGFVYLRQVDPSIQQDIRYATYHNFVGRPIDGYNAPECILTYDTALALQHIQEKLAKSHLSLKVYDCYRPTRAVQNFVNWWRNSNEAMKEEFYPNLSKKDLFKLGYIATASGHSRGSTVDLTVVPLPSSIPYYQGESLVSCYSDYSLRFPDNSLDMGTGYDCFDLRANVYNGQISQSAMKNRLLLRKLMVQEGFRPYSKEWWHFTLRNEEYPHSYFNFPIGS